MSPLTVAKTVSWVGLALVLVPSVLAMSGSVSGESVKWLALTGTVVWFVAAALWIGRDEETQSG
ncbi:MAG: hypothetical protein AAFU85_06160 [Planctomycetota bacterium]